MRASEMNLHRVCVVYMGMKNPALSAVALLSSLCAFADAASTNDVADLGVIVVEGDALSRYRPDTVSGATFTDLPPEFAPTVVDTLTQDFIRERNPTDMNDLLRNVPGIETGGTSLLVRQPGLFSIRGMGGTEPSFDGVIPVGRGAGLFMDPYMMERVEVVKGPVGSLSGGMGAQQNNNGAGGSINMHLKGARLDGSRREVQETTSVGRNVWRQRGLIDANEVLADDRFAVRVAGSFDLYSPAYISNGSQDGARPRQAWTVAPSFVAKPAENVTFGVKSMFVAVDAPSYIGVPVWRGHPAGGYGWYESSCLSGDRSKYSGMMVNPYVDLQVTDDWLLKFGGAFMYSHAEQTTREPYNGNGMELQNFFRTGEWTSGNKYMTSGFSESRWFSRSFNAYARSIYAKDELPWGFRNTFVAQPDFYWRDSSVFGAPVTRWGATLQDSIGWGWITILGGLRCDYFIEDSSNQKSVNRATGATTVTHYASADQFALSPRGGLTVKPLDWLVFFGNISQTRTPTLGYRDADGSRPTDPWRATQYEAGIRVRPVEKLWLAASYFNIDQKNTPVLNSDNQTYYFDGHNRSQGVEFSATGDITENWTVMAMYAYTYYTDYAENHGNKARHFARTPRHALTINTSYRIPVAPLDGIAVGLGYRFRSESYATMRGAFVDDNLYFKPANIFDVSMTVPFTKFGAGDWGSDWFLTLGVRNVLGEKYFETSRHYYECFVGEPRTFEIGLLGRF